MCSMILKRVNKLVSQDLILIMMYIRGAYSVIKMVISNALVKEEVEK